MSNELTKREWMTAKEAARVLKVTDRMVNHYGHNGQIRTQRAGRRVMYHVGDVEALAGSLQVDLRPQHITRNDAGEQMVQYIRQREQADQEILESLRRLPEMDERLRRMEEQQRRPPRGPSWQLILALVIALIIALVILAIVAKVF